MFDSFRQSLNDLMDRATPPEERRAVLARMKATLVQARMGLDDLRGGPRKAAAAVINDAETLALAEKYEAHHSQRADVLTRKLDAQEAELAMAEAEVAEMTAELKKAVSTGGMPGAPSLAEEARVRDEVNSVLDGGAAVADEIDALGRANARSARDAEAERQLAELKRRMGK